MENNAATECMVLKIIRGKKAAPIMNPIMKIPPPGGGIRITARIGQIGITIENKIAVSHSRIRLYNLTNTRTEPSRLSEVAVYPPHGPR